MSNDEFFKQTRRIGAAVIDVKGCRYLTEEALSEYFWSKIGINIPPEHISVTPHPNADRATVVLTREVLADWLSRAVADQLLDSCQPQIFPSAFGLYRR